MFHRIKKYQKLVKLINFYPPFLFSGIKLLDYNEDFTYFKVRLKISWYNQNIVGVAFGGSLYAMCDPFFMFILMLNLGQDYIVWDKAADIDFVKPGKGTVYATFQLSHSTIEDIRQELEEVSKKVYSFPCEVRDKDGEIIARLNKAVYVRKK